MSFDGRDGDVDVGDDCHFADVIAEVVYDDDGAGVGDDVRVFLVVVDVTGDVERPKGTLLTPILRLQEIQRLTLKAMIFVHKQQLVDGHRLTQL